MNQEIKKPEYNFEKQYSSVIELKSEIQKVIEINMSSLSSSLSSKSLESTNHLEQLVSIIEQNKSSIALNIGTLCKSLSEKMANRIEAFHSLQNMYVASLQKSKLLIKGKKKYKEYNLMKKSEMISIQYEISQLTNKIKTVQKQSNNLETEIANLKKENKNSYTTEITLLEQVMSFDKRLYTVFSAREGLIKQKQQIQSEINLKEVHMKKQITAQTQIKIKTITKHINDCNNSLNYIFPIQSYWNLRLNEHNVLEKEISNYYTIQTSKVDELNMKKERQFKLSSSLVNESNKVNDALIELISHSKIQFPFVTKILASFPDEKQSPFSLMNKIINEIRKSINDKQNQRLLLNEKIEFAKDKIKKIELNTTLSFYRKMTIGKIIHTLKDNSIKNKIARQKIHEAEIVEKERANKLALLKQKEAQLIKELEIQKEKQTMRLMEVRKEKAEKKPKKGKKKERSKDKEINGDEEGPQNDKVNIKNITIPQVTNRNNGKPFLNELDKIEKSFYTENSNQISFDNLNFFDELSKNIQEVHNFHQKSVFGDKKNKYSKYGFI